MKEEEIQNTNNKKNKNYVEKWEINNDELKTIIIDLKKNIEEINNNNLKFKNELEEKTKKLEKTQNEMEEKTKKFEKTQNEIEDTKKKLEKTQNELEITKKKLIEHDKKIENLETNYELLFNQLSIFQMRDIFKNIIIFFADHLEVKDKTSSNSFTNLKNIMNYLSTDDEKKYNLEKKKKLKKFFQTIFF